MREEVSSIESLIELVSHIIIIIINFTASYISSQLCEVCPIFVLINVCIFLGMYSAITFMSHSNISSYTVLVYVSCVPKRTSERF